MKTKVNEEPLYTEEDIINVNNKMVQKRKKEDAKNKKYCFDYIEENVKRWNPSLLEDITKEMLLNTPLCVNFFSTDVDNITPPRDYYGEVIDDIDDWFKQREVYIDELYDRILQRHR